MFITPFKTLITPCLQHLSPQSQSHLQKNSNAQNIPVKPDASHITADSLCPVYLQQTSDPRSFVPDSPPAPALVAFALCPSSGSSQAWNGSSPPEHHHVSCCVQKTSEFGLLGFWPFWVVWDGAWVVWLSKYGRHA